MKLTVKNLGPISAAEVDLSKDLIILTGENNTGKTYLAYLIYNIFHLFISKGENWITSTKNVKLDENFFEKKNHFNQNKTVSFDLAKTVKSFISSSNLNKISQRFAVDSSFFKDLIIEIQSSEKFDKQIKSIEINKFFKNEDYEYADELKVTKLKGSLDINLKIKENDRGHSATSDAKGLIADLVREEFLYNCFIIPAERQGINIFHKELALIKNKAFDELLSNGHRTELLNFLQTRFNKYPKPVKDALETTQNLDAIQKQRSEFENLGEYLEKGFLKGEIYITDDGDIRFKPENSFNSLEIHMTSSTIKSLATLTIYLNHIAKKGDFIIIDEPELNLHPDNQVKIARFITRLISEGFKVMISTHSDYILRELNTLIMLGSGKKEQPEETKELQKKYKIEDKELLDHQKVGVHLFQVGKPVENVNIDKLGFNIKTIDKTVDYINQSSQEIYVTLFD